ncbi:TetR/AcrR family transcriptional regulator [Pseudomonas sp. MAFF212428]|uniref:TetR/AcrR family transcriptional regulator n=1 Tax=Pseudomonas brassicae TaxID=2708063 RepID=A0A6B3NXG1_9PSED|nr:TetR/AcrR family transcriptional regulator [Pseudomonas brassicae]NER61894.1 TetR/AcrR family transcriptional regulator [Pseudomonas brassicae]NER65821.1 TetR/AcrR family transcriptional regulator [Pseudomonas brassicae]
MSSKDPLPVRRRLSREGRHEQLLEVAWQVVREEGTDALTLGRLAEAAGVTKPVVYDHFGSRSGLLAVLYQAFDDRQTALMDAALASGEATLQGQAQVIARSYVTCVLTQGQEIAGVIAALAGSPQLSIVKAEYEVIFLNKCRAALAPFAGEGGVSQAGLRGMLGAAEALSHAAATGEISPSQAQQELFETIVGMVGRQRGSAAPVSPPPGGRDT